MESDETQEDPHPPEEASTEPTAGDAQPGQDQETTLSGPTLEQDEATTLVAEAEAAPPAEGEAAAAPPAGNPSGPVTTLPPRSNRRRVGFSLLAVVAALLVALVVVTSVIASRQPPAATGAKTAATPSPTPHQVSVYGHTYTPTFQLGANGSATPTTPISSRVFALNGADGTLRWQYMLSNSIGTSQVATDDVLYVGINDGNVSAFDTSTGKLLWNVKLLEHTTVQQVVNGVVYVFSQDDKGNQHVIYALDASTGKQLWQFAKADTIDLLANGVLYASLGSLDFGFAPAPFTSLSRSTTAAGAAASSPGTIYALDATTGAERWHFQHAGGLSVKDVIGSQVFVTDLQITLFEIGQGGVKEGVSSQSTVYALDASTGKQLWSYPKNTSHNETLNASLVGAENGMVYIYTSSFFLSISAPHSQIPSLP